VLALPDNAVQVVSGTEAAVLLAALTADEGEYELRLVAEGSGIVNRAGVYLAADVAVSWRMDITAPTAQMSAVSPAVRTTPVSEIEVVFSETVVGVDIADFRLARNNMPISLPAAALRQAGDGRFIIDLASLSAAEGEYVFSFESEGAGIADMAGNAWVGRAWTSWRMTAANSPPVVVSIKRLDKNPVRYPNTNIRFRVTFSEPVTGVDASDFVVLATRNASAEISAISRLSPAEYAVALKNVQGQGTIGLAVLDDDTIVDDHFLPLGGVGSGNGDYADGQIYNVKLDKPVRGKCPWWVFLRWLWWFLRHIIDGLPW